MTTRKSRTCCAFELLETRRHCSTTTPTANEQYMLELINRARANPTAEASGDGISLNEGPPSSTISSTAKQPLAFNSDLIDASRSHSSWMLSSGLFQHPGPGSTTPFQRDQQAGYNFGMTYGQGENIAWEGTTGTLNTVTTTADEHKSLFIDSGEPGRGHRVNIETDAYKEIGIGMETGKFQGYNALMTTQDFAYTTENSFLTGVAYSDTIKADNFYTPGEGLGGVTVTATPVGGGAAVTTTTWSSGGYNLQLPDGTYHVTATGGGLGTTVIDKGNVTLNGLNVEEDFVGGSISPTGTPPTAKLTAKTLSAVATTYSFTVTYTGTAAIDTSTLSRGDVLVTGPSSYRQYAKFISFVSSNGGKTIKATYRISPATGTRWRSTSNGTYHAYVRASQVSDKNGLSVVAALLGAFKFKIA